MATARRRPGRLTGVIFLAAGLTVAAGPAGAGRAAAPLATMEPALATAPGLTTGANPAAARGFARAGAPGHPPAAQRSLVFERFDADYLVQARGTVLVTETLQPRFSGSWNGIIRDLQLTNTTAGGDRVKVEVELRSVTDGDGRPLHYEVERPDSRTRRFRIWVPGAENATRTVVIQYAITRNAIRFFDEGSDTGPLDEFYWQVTGTNWEVPIQRASARVMLPEGVAVQQAAAYVGGPSSTRQTDVVVEGGVVRVPDTGPFAPGEGLTVAVGWPPGVVQRPPITATIARVIRTWWPVVLPFLVFWVAYRKWEETGKDPEERSIMVHYDPPKGLRPAELGTLVDNNAEMHDITSMLVDLAVRGYLRIEEEEKDGILGKLSGKDYTFHLLRSAGDWADLEAYERSFLDALFAFGDAGDTVRLSDLKNRFYKKVPAVKARIYERLMERAYYERRPDKVMRRWMGMAAVIVFVGVSFFFSGAAGTSTFSMVLAGSLIVCGVVVGGFGTVMAARTEAGARAREAGLGFKEFLDKVETDRYKRMITSPELFERYLPFAMAFQVEAKWAKAFEDLYTEPPDWYVSHGGYHGGFYVVAFTNDLSSMNTAASSTMASSPGGSSGSGGGGSVGGGGGGGGGGGF